VSRDPHRLDRFVQAQAPVWAQVQEELRAGRKTSHWMWFVFPQLRALGRSATAQFYGLADAEEARAYVSHPVLGSRLIECCELLLAIDNRSATEVFGHVDTLKLRSCLTLFAAVAPDEPVFHRCLQHWFAGEADPLTLQLLQP